MYKAYKYRIYPNENQKVFFAKTFGCVRFLFNKMLGERKELYEKYKENKEELKKDKPKSYTAWKKEFDFMKEVDSLALANADINLKDAYRNFFRNSKTIGFPKFTSKHRDLDRYTTNNQHENIRIENNRIKLPKIGNIKIVYHRKISQGQTIKSVTVSKTKTGKYFVSVLVKYEDKQTSVQINLAKAIGLDFSMPHFFVDNQNKKGSYPKFLRQAEKKLTKEQRKLSKCIFKSSNYFKQKYFLALAHEKVKNQRKDWLEKISKDIADNFDIVCIEDINMQTMSRTLNFGKSVHDSGWGMFISMLKRKVKQLITIDKWFPSSKKCNYCGHINIKIELKDRSFVCENCKRLIDRDRNAALNILLEGLKTKTTVGTTELAY